MLESFDRGLPEVMGEVFLSVTLESTSVRPTVAACGSEDVTFATTSEKSVGGTGGVGAVGGTDGVGAEGGTDEVGVVN